MRRKVIAAFLTPVILSVMIIIGCTPKTTVIYTTVVSTNESATTGTATDWDNIPPAYPDVPQISATELKKMMDDGAPLIIIDVRDQPSYAFSHIPGAVNFAFDPTADPMIMTMQMWTIPGGRTVIFYCNCPDDNLSGRFAQQLIDEGMYPDVKDLRHGIAAWWEEGYPIVTGSTVADFVTTTMASGK